MANKELEVQINSYLAELIDVELDEDQIRLTESRICMIRKISSDNE